MRPELAVDLGTARVRVAAPGHGVVLDEPTVVAVDLERSRVVALGRQALALRGRAAGRVAIERPVARGELLDLDLAHQLVRHAVRRLPRSLRASRAVVCTPAGATGVQRRALARALREAGVRRVRFLEAPLAVAIGQRLPVADPKASMVLDVGAGRSEAGVLALGGVAAAVSTPVGGDDLDEAVRASLLQAFDLLVERAVARQVKERLGRAGPGGEEAKAEVAGRDVSNGRVRRVVVTGEEVASVLEPALERVVRTAVRAITSAPADLANDLLASGLYLAGGTASLPGLDRRVADAAGVPVHVVEDGGLAALRGALRCAAAPRRYERLLSAPARRR